MASGRRKASEKASFESEADEMIVNLTNKLENEYGAKVGYVFKEDATKRLKSEIDYFPMSTVRNLANQLIEEDMVEARKINLQKMTGNKRSLKKGLTLSGISAERKKPKHHH